MPRRDYTADELARQTRAAKGLLDELGTDDSVLNHDMVEGETNLFEAIDAALNEIDECQMIAIGCKAKEDQISTRRKAAENRAERLRSMIEQSLAVADLGEALRTPLATFSIADLPPKVLVEDESKIPAAYWKTGKPTLDKAKLKEDIDAGKTVPGVTKTNGSISLKIRRV